MKEVLLVNDIAGIGKVALSAMIPILSEMKVHVHNLPTAVISNNFSYGQSEIYPLTDYMDRAQKTWEKLDFQFDVITTGIIMDEQQVDIIERLIKSQKTKPLVITDPIMGDEGTLYPGLPEGIIKATRKIVPLADILIPNSTEAALILGKDHPEEEFEEEEIKSWIDELIARGARAVIITSAETKDGSFVFAYSEEKGHFKVEYEHLPVHFGGTGDIFSALITGKLANGSDLKEAVEYAVKILSSILKEESKRGKDVIIDVPIEKYLAGLDHLV